MSRFLTAHRQNYVIQCHSDWFRLEIRQQTN